jgi:hypothetical protein
MNKQKTYVIMTSDGIGYDEVFLSWDAEYHYFTTVDELDEINEFDFHHSIEEAEARALSANSFTLGGWSYPMFIMEVVDFDEQELELVKQVDLG